MEERKYHGKTLSDAITNACADLGITSDKLSYKVIQEEKKGFLGLSIGARECIIEINERNEAPKQTAPKKPAAENKPAEQPKRKPAVQIPVYLSKPNFSIASRTAATILILTASTHLRRRRTGSAKTERIDIRFSDF